MRSKMVRRYYCDFCPKSGCNSGHIRKHEQRCVRNPSRECRMCERVGGWQAPLAELVAAMDSDEGLPALRRAASECPVCILSGIIGWRALRAHELDAEDLYVDFDFKAEVQRVWDEENTERAALVGTVDPDAELPF